MASFKVSQFQGVTDTTADSLLMLSYTSDAGSTFATRKIRVADLLNDIAQDADLTALVTLTGVDAGATDLGQFSGQTISDSSSLKGALQQLETALELQQDALTAGSGITLAENGDISVKLKTSNSYLEFGASDGLGVKVLDEDDFASNSADHLPTQQSVKTYVDANLSGREAAADERYIHQDGSQAFEADQSMGGFRLTNLASPVASTDAASKQYVDESLQGLDVKQSVRVATTGDIVLSGLIAVDGVVLDEGDRVLVRSQTDKKENGIYVVSNTAWARSEDADDSPDGEVHTGLFTFVEEGVENSGHGYTLTTANPIVLGTSELEFAQFSGAGQIIAGSGIVIDGNTVSVDPGVLSDVTDLTTLTGRNSNATDLGAFSGSTIQDTQTIKGALQDLETAVEANAANVATNDADILANAGDIATNLAAIQGNDSDIADILLTIGTADGDTNLGAFSGSTITDGATVKQALQSIETSLEAFGAAAGDATAVSNNQAEITALRLAQGTNGGDTDLGAFTGVTITSNASVKQALQDLESAVELAANNAEVEALQILAGRPTGSTSHGAFTPVGTYNIFGSAESDHSAFQKVLNELGRVDSLLGFSGFNNIGDSPGSILPFATDVESGMHALEAAIEQNQSDIANSGFVSAGDNVNLLTGSTSAQTEPANYLFLVVDRSNGAIKVIDKTFIETEESG